MRCGRDLGAAQSQGLLAAALRAVLNLRLGTIAHGNFETLGLPPLWVGRVRRISRYLSLEEADWHQIRIGATKERG